MNGIASGENLSPATIDDGEAVATLVAVGDGTGDGDPALAGAGDGAAAAVGEGTGAGVAGLTEATCGFDGGVISSLVR